jgi:hypothetical protein
MNAEDNTPWQYKPDSGSADSNLPDSDDHTPREHSKSSPNTITWEAPEFIEHPHGASWYMMLFLATAGLAGIVYIISKDLIATVTMIVVGVIVAIFAGQKPKQAKYEINTTGLRVNNKTYKYSDYKSFAVINEGPLTSVNLFPLKRLMPPVSAYFEPKDGDKITKALGNHLPYENRRLDSIDRLSRRLRL